MNRKINLTVIILFSIDSSVEKLDRARRSVRFADEVLVIENQKPIKDFSKVRNEAMERAKGEWVVFVDCDEEVSEGLAEEMIRKISKISEINKINRLIDKWINRRIDKPAVGYRMRRADRFLGKWLGHGETASVRLLRLARMGAGRWERPVHEVWKIGGRIVELKNPIRHYSHESVAEMLKKLDNYSTIEADYRLGRLGELGRLGKLGILGEMAVFPAGKFIQNYFWRLGVLDGMEGFIHALMMSGHSFLVRAKILSRMDANQIKRMNANKRIER